MKYRTLFFVAVIIFFGYSYSQKTDTNLVKFNGSYFYNISNPLNFKALIFLHGGVNNPAFLDKSKIPELDFLLEENKLLIPTSIVNGYDLIIPISSDSLNWLVNTSYCFDKIMKYCKHLKEFESISISGFSDGGTGSYKIFYENKEHFDGLIVFNGYPQHKNFYKAVNYEKISDKKIAFFSTFDDKTIPYEFLLTEYCQQKKYNSNTFFYLAKGNHTFLYYDQKALNICFNILNSKITNSKKEQIHAYMENDQIIEFYTFRKKIYKKFKYGEEYYKANIEQSKIYKK